MWHVNVSFCSHISVTVEIFFETFLRSVATPMSSNATTVLAFREILSAIAPMIVLIPPMKYNVVSQVPVATNISLDVELASASMRLLSATMRKIALTTQMSPKSFANMSCVQLVPFVVVMEVASIPMQLAMASMIA